MFSQELDNIKCFADEFSRETPELNRISSVNFGADMTQEAFARALLFKRLPEGQTFSIIKLATREAPAILDCNTIYYVPAPEHDEIVDNFAKNHADFTYIEKQSEFIKKWFFCEIYNRPETNTAVLLIDDSSIRNIHMSMSLFSVYVPKLFEERPLTDFEKKQLCCSLTNRSSVAFIQAMEQLTKDEGLDVRAKELKLLNYTRSIRGNLVDAAKTEMTAAKADLDRNIAQYLELSKIYQDKKFNLESLMAMPDEKDDTLVRCFKSHKNLNLIDVENGTIKFEVLTELNWFDIDYYRNASRSGAIYNFDCGVTFAEYDDRKLLMDAIFCDDPEYRIKLCAYYEIKGQRGGEVFVYSDHEYSEACKDRMPNPHLQMHACLGNYRTPIRKCLEAGNIVGAVDQCVASAQSVNLAETGITFKPFMTRVLNSKKKILLTRSGASISPETALKRLKEKEKKA